MKEREAILREYDYWLESVKTYLEQKQDLEFGLGMINGLRYALGLVCYSDEHTPEKVLAFIKNAIDDRTDQIDLESRNN